MDGDPDMNPDPVSPIRFGSQALGCSFRLRKSPNGTCSNRGGAYRLHQNYLIWTCTRDWRVAGARGKGPDKSRRAPGLSLQPDPPV